MILLVVEHANGKLAKSAYEMAAAGRALGREGPITALVLGEGVAAVADQAARIAEQVLVADLPELASYDSDLWSAAAAGIAQEGHAHTIFFGPGRAGRESSARVAVKLDAALLEDVIALGHAGGVTTAGRYTYLSRVTAKLETAAPVVVVTLKPGVFAAVEAGDTPGEQFDAELHLPTRRVQVTGRTTEKSARIPLADAEIVVSGGRGAGTPEAFVQLVEGLAGKLGAAVGATRAVVDAGWRPYSEQVGQTGKTVQPKVYIAIGISGAVQHLSGMNKSKYIVAINKDPDAPIFKIADLGVVGSASEIVPALIEEIERRRSAR
ncbi:MAG TPA: electron transfer flavoprotein subunit alpha/FixB family protein [Acidobacteriaceae bacterium]|jgi:electron transfer flavoprotein alpha subunit|nr:electron transfer flavoprotein subunit alpha/FixB family protein [Acidobacteriaceae bacterium]